MAAVEATSSNATTGAGVADSWNSVAKACEEIKTAHDADRAALAVEIGVTVASGIVDTVAFVLDPLAKLISAGFGWLIEHVSFLRWPLDQVAGNPDQIKVLADRLHGIAEDLRNTAADLEAALGTLITQWQGPSYDAFRGEMDGHKAHIDARARSVDISGYVVETTMALIAAVRALFRDIITTLIGDIIATMLVALSLAVLTCGASVVAGTATVVAKSSVEAASLTGKMAKVSAFAARVAERLKNLANLSREDEGISGHSAPPGSGGGSAHGTPRPSTTHSGDDAPTTRSNDNGSATTSGHRDETSGGSGQPDEEDPFHTWLLADRYFNGPGASHDDPPAPVNQHQPTDTAPTTHPAGNPPTGQHPADGQIPSANRDSHETDSPGNSHHEEAPPKPEPKSLLRDQDIALLKKHEDWLRAHYGESQAKAKFMDNWVKAHAPDSYPLVKAMADAKSGKNWIGWIDKDIVTVDKQLTDIQNRAEEAWNESDEKWRETHPDPTAL